MRDRRVGRHPEATRIAVLLHRLGFPVFDTRAGRDSRDAVCLSGYPMVVLSINTEDGLVGNVRRYWQPTLVIGVTQAIVDGRAYHRYIVGQPCFSGMSGDRPSVWMGRYAAWRERRSPGPFRGRMATLWS